MGPPLLCKEPSLVLPSHLPSSTVQCTARHTQTNWTAGCTEQASQHYKLLQGNLWLASRLWKSRTIWSLFVSPLRRNQSRILPCNGHLLGTQVKVPGQRSCPGSWSSLGRAVLHCPWSHGHPWQELLFWTKLGQEC